MATTIHLDEGLDPPKGEKRLIVARDATGAHFRGAAASRQPAAARPAPG